MRKMEIEEFEIVYSWKEIWNMLPHRYPFLLVDEVRVKKDEYSGVGKKNVTINEPYFTGHFPGEPVVPGALIIESIAQTVAVVYAGKYNGMTEDVAENHVGYLASANVKFLNKVEPGDTMMIYVDLENKFGKFSSYNAVVYVGKHIAAKGCILVTQR